MSALETIASAIGEFIADRGEFLILEADRDRNYYIQLHSYASGGSELWVEAVSDNHLAPSDRLTFEASLQLAALGWDAPTSQDDNWHRVVPVPSREQIEALGTLVVETFACVYGIADLSALNFIWG